ncbi:MAG: CDP-alcohol phosphatidyltransferase family protein [Flavobacteriaceae bacterium]|nr:CDP-alcohol phosphatidyltransferase family protein [Flavobacteriaceae bacterium]
MKIKRHLPNLLTLTNLLSGCLLVFLSAQLDEVQFQYSSNTYVFLVLILISLVCDLLDGMVARWLQVSSPLGLQLDSLADMVTFGVFPGVLMVKMLENSLSEVSQLLALLGFGITLFSALRLAKFNVDLTQTSYFKGLATPANAVMIFGIFILFQNYPEFFIANGFNVLLAITIISSYLLVSNIPLFSFKLKSYNIKNLLPHAIFLLCGIIALLMTGLNALSFIIILYIVISIIFKKSFVHA